MLTHKCTNLRYELDSAVSPNLASHSTSIPGLLPRLTAPVILLMLASL